MSMASKIAKVRTVLFSGAICILLWSLHSGGNLMWCSMGISDFSLVDVLTLTSPPEIPLLLKDLM